MHACSHTFTYVFTNTHSHKRTSHTNAHHPHAHTGFQQYLVLERENRGQLYVGARRADVLVLVPAGARVGRVGVNLRGQVVLDDMYEGLVAVEVIAGLLPTYEYHSDVNLNTTVYNCRPHVRAPF